jgi:hypothetical protein
MYTGERSALVVHHLLAIDMHISATRQKYGDFAFCEAAKYQTGDGPHKLPLLLIYDIACQWSIHFKKRVTDNQVLEFEDFDQLKFAVGKFHLGSHVDKCYWKYTLNYMQGAGHLDGEIMETIWSQFNKGAVTARSMSNAHRWEFLNDHMRDINFKKMVGMGKCYVASVTFISSYIWEQDNMLCSKLKRAAKGHETTKQAFEELSEKVSLDRQEEWLKLEAEALAIGGSALDVYGMSLDKG